MVNCIIDGKKVSVAERTTILEAASLAGIKIPTLCFLKDINEIAACRVCVVEVEGYERLLTACNNTVAEGMVIHTHSRKAREARRTNVELILSQHNTNCAICVRSGNCTLQQVANDLNIVGVPFEKQLPRQKSSETFPLIRDYDKCIQCMRCVQVCEKIQASSIWDVVNTGSKATVDVRDVYRLEDSKCALCGQCITHCPVGALRERDDTDRVLEALEDPTKTVVVQIAPSIRTAWGEAFGLSPEQATMQRLAAALKHVGFDYVFDTNFTADLTIMEEGTELLHLIKEGDRTKFPLFTSCCPGWVRFAKARYPEFVSHISTSKSPQQMFGAVMKSYFAEKQGIDPENIVSVSIMPCVAKKAECDYPTMVSDGHKDVDIVLTTRELNRLIRSEHILVSEIEEITLDSPFPNGSGAGNIFGATGGVMEAALRSAYYLVTNENPDPDAFKSVRGLDGWKEAEFEIAGIPLKVAVVNGLGNAGRLLTELKAGRVQYDFVEVMACPGGCVGGGGQPIHDQQEMAGDRGSVLYFQDRHDTLRFSHENPAIKTIYEEYLENPLSERSEALLHTDQFGWDMPS